MSSAYLYKILQRQLKFRNPNHLLELPRTFLFSFEEERSAKNYIELLKKNKISFTYPGDSDYPEQFRKMKEPPLFFEYQGLPHWKKTSFISIVGSRNISLLTESWLKNHISDFIIKKRLGVVSGGALGVDQAAHLIAIKKERPTLFVLPSGLNCLYPNNLKDFFNLDSNQLATFVSEFEVNQKINKSHFYYRNRLIAAFGNLTLVAQATLKSGSLLTVHHCLENGRPVLTVPSHPEVVGFEGNLKLMADGAYAISNSEQLLDFWNAEVWSS